MINLEAKKMYAVNAVQCGIPYTLYVFEDGQEASAFAEKLTDTDVFITSCKIVPKGTDINKLLNGGK